MGVHVVVGATGGTGTALVRELLGRGEVVRAVSRRGDCAVPGVEAVAGDAADARRMREVCDGAAAVYNCVNPPFAQWRAVFPETVRSLVAAAGAADAVLAFADDTWMYGAVDGPMTEETPVRPVSELGVFRAWLAEMTLAAHYRGAARTVIARGGELYGPNVESLFGQNLFGRATLGRRPILFGDPTLPLTPTYIGDFARTLATVAADPTAHGQVWHTPHPAPTTALDFTALATTAKPITLPSGVTTALKLVSPVVRQGAQLLYQFHQPFIVNGNKFTAAYPQTPTPYADGVAATLTWYQGHKHQIRTTALPS
ncbi:NAD-dependent epimerase/dehydratase family protein [Kribbella sandramycini]|uniref:NAD-dependent epimerase/dehydratase family protein n=1 Tax=Kribbella sandramycini TaxID=60450 RepID=A0A7Y4NYN6_9ACTN|nr:NAD-dependent epimerase/dehydratase family protein [Kribbella sandramycini]MBB6569433.1 nucleoside-diphosphate-sugar epimerase [Kribbella sandramycini]NOL40731.1 NAD-dependent epimerase/dehydratase family protein [Kribbella sandramycini]